MTHSKWFVVLTQNRHLGANRILPLYFTKMMLLALFALLLSSASSFTASTSSSPLIHKHLFRHYDDISFDSWLRCADPEQFLKSVGYSSVQTTAILSAYPQLLTTPLSVHSQLAPKIRFLVETMQGGTGGLTWSDDSALPSVSGDDEECSLVLAATEEKTHSMRLSPQTIQSVPLDYYSSKYSVDRSLGPRHAYLMHHGLTHGLQLLQDKINFKDFVKASSESAASFASLCNSWGRESARAPHTAESVSAFEKAFCPGLLPGCRAFELENCAELTPVQLVTLLLAHGANHLETDRHGSSPLHWAAGTGKLEAVKGLMDAFKTHVDVDMDEDDKFAEILVRECKAKDGSTPFHWACCGINLPNHRDEPGVYSSFDVCKYLLEHSKERRTELANAKTFAHDTPFMWATWSSSLPLLDMLLVHGADPHAIDKQGANAAHWAAAGGHLNVCEYLHHYLNVDFTLVDKTGNTPLDNAIAYGHQDVVDWIRRVVETESVVTNTRARNEPIRYGYQ